MDDLEQRIAAALTAADIASTELSALVAETDAAIAAADRTAEEERERALDPIVSPDPKQARAAMEDAAFTRDRLKTLLPRLQARWQEVALAELLAAWKIDFEKARVERDAMVAELRERYPAAVATLVDLMARIADVDRRVDAVNGAAPPGAQGRLHRIEREARGELMQADVSIAKELRLPVLDRNGGPVLAWPQPVAALDLIRACQPVHVDTSRWFEDIQKRDRVALEENRRQIREAEQMQRQREEREAREAEAAKAADRAAYAAHGWPA